MPINRKSVYYNVQNHQVMMIDCIIFNRFSLSVQTSGQWLYHFDAMYYKHRVFVLTHCGQVTHICVGKLIIIGSDNGLPPDRRQAIIWTNAGLLSIGPSRIYFSENLIKMQQFSLKKMHVKMSSAKWRLSCLSHNVLNRWVAVSPVHGYALVNCIKIFIVFVKQTWWTLVLQSLDGSTCKKHWNMALRMLSCRC